MPTDKLGTLIDWLMEEEEANKQAAREPATRFIHEQYAKEEEKFYRNPKPTPALETAITAVNKRKSRMKFTAIAEDRKNLWVKEGESYFGIFRGEIHDFKIHWVDKKKRKCLGLACPICATGDKARFQFRVNFVMKNAEGAMEPVIYEQDWFTYKRLGKLSKELEPANLEEQLVQIYKGHDGEFKADLFKVIKPLDSETIKAVEGVQLLDIQDGPVDRYAGQEQDIPF
jgi:hypothetical protein